MELRHDDSGDLGRRPASGSGGVCDAGVDRLESLGRASLQEVGDVQYVVVVELVVDGRRDR